MTDYERDMANDLALDGLIDTGNTVIKTLEKLGVSRDSLLLRSIAINGSVPFAEAHIDFENEKADIWIKIDLNSNITIRRSEKAFYKRSKQTMTPAEWNTNLVCWLDGWVNDWI